MTFDYQSFGNKVHFGKGKLQELPAYLEPYQRIFIIGEDRVQPQIDTLTAQLSGKATFVFSEVVQHVPVGVVEKAFGDLQNFNADVLLSIGGGSSTGLAKALALKKALPIIAVPTTYAGSEQTNIYGTTSNNGKTTGRNDVVLPKIVVYDPALTQTMPLALAVKSAMNAMAHLVEAIYSPTYNPVTQQLAIYGIQQIREGLEEVARNKSLTESINEKFVLGSYLGGKSLCEVAMALHHKVAHVLGGSFNLDHASVHTVLQAYVLDYQWNYLSDEIKQIFVQTLGKNPGKKLKELAQQAGVETDLKSIGFKEENIEKAAELIVSAPYPNPAPVTKDGMIEMLNKAYRGSLS